jgi:hypothetical protein
MTSLPELFLGKAIKSRMVSCPPRMATNRSNPKLVLRVVLQTEMHPLRTHVL